MARLAEQICRPATLENAAAIRNSHRFFWHLIRFPAAQISDETASCILKSTAKKLLRKRLEREREKVPLVSRTTQLSSAPENQQNSHHDPEDADPDAAAGPASSAGREM